jgi:hypothetical protein
MERSGATVAREDEQPGVGGARGEQQFLLPAVDEASIWRHGQLVRVESGQRWSRGAPIQAFGVDTAGSAGRLTG